LLGDGGELAGLFGGLGLFAREGFFGVGFVFGGLFFGGFFVFVFVVFFVEGFGFGVLVEVISASARTASSRVKRSRWSENLHPTCP
jgi:hypothetical protein